MVTQETANHIESTLAGFIGYLRRKKMSDRTINAYTSDVRSFLNRTDSHGNSTALNSIVAVQTKDLEDYLYGLARSGLQFASVRRVSCALKSFFLFLLDQGVIHKNHAVMLAVSPVRPEVLSSEHIVSIFQYLTRRQLSAEESDLIRYHRDELILLLMIFYGVPQYQLSTLRLSSIHTTKKSVSLIISTRASLQLHLSVLRKLRTYLELRKSTCDTIFLESFGDRPIHKMSIRHVLNELSFALKIECTPKSLQRTYAFLQQQPEIKESLTRRILSNGSTHTYATTTNA